MRLLIVPADRTEPHGGARNLGDAFLTDSLASAVASRGHGASIYDFGPVDRKSSDLGRLRGGRGRDLYRAIVAHDAVVVGGGTMLQDNRPDLLLGGLPRLCAVVSATARSARRPVAYFGVGLDTMERSLPRSLVGLAVAGCEVWVREEGSHARFEAYFGRQPHLGADASLLVEELDCPVPAANGGRRLTVALNRDHASQLRMGQLTSLQAVFDSVAFLPMDQEPANSDGDALAPDVQAAIGYRPRVRGWRDAAAEIGSSSVVLGSRMHALYLAALLARPMVAVGSADKVIAFTEEFGIPLIARVSDYRPGTERVADRSALERAKRRAGTSLDELLAALEATRHRRRS